MSHKSWKQREKQIKSMICEQVWKSGDRLAATIARIRQTPPPLMAIQFPDHEQLNSRLRPKLMFMSETVPNKVTNRPSGKSFFSNRWLSATNLFELNDPDIQELVHRIEEYVNQRLELMQTDDQVSIFSMWCIVGKTGMEGRRHTHFGKISGVYYVDSGCSDDPKSGAMQVFPKWIKPLWPDKKYWGDPIAEYRQGIPTITPKPGLLLLFPSNMCHSVLQYVGHSERIVVSFNLN